ncbi:hypothetical protein HPP92_007695 [Vanilla planifolia]|uniref:Uncharacterized protein n=1 Tax=Vanilla planifolia TaxID=51239 RepID=A0A835RRW6_VANPL|nr:hypothetical protein HPP92_007695 [Vanilla planifolia]
MLCLWTPCLGLPLGLGAMASWGRLRPSLLVNGAIQPRKLYHLLRPLRRSSLLGSALEEETEEEEMGVQP